jgi:predicted dinucleotide-binding enzyme
MKIAVIGAGSVGGTLGARLAGKGHEVAFGVRDPGASKYQELANNIGERSRVGTVPDAVADAEVIILATPWPATEQALRQAGNLAGKILLDCTNPLKPDLTGLVVEESSSGGEHVARWARGAKVFKAFNTVGFNIMADPVIDGRKAVMLVCGDDDETKPTVLRLVEDVGFEAVDFGKLTGARLLELFALMWIQLAYQHGLGRDFAFSLVRR